MTAAGGDEDAVQIGGHPVHLLAAVFAELPSRAQEALTASIVAVGLLVPILRFEGAVLEGRGRLRACVEAGVEPQFEDLADGVDPLEALLAANLDRRRLSRSQRAVSAARVATLDRGRPKKGQSCTFTVEEAAKRFGISPRLVKSARVVLRRESLGLVSVVEWGLVSVSRASSLTALDEDALASLVTKLGSATGAAGRAEIVREALEEAGLRKATPEEPPELRMKESVEVLAAHVRAADEPGGALRAVFADLARQAGLAVNDVASTGVEAGAESGDATEARPSLELVEGATDDASREAS
jgi:hypothetical protein